MWMNCWGRSPKMSDASELLMSLTKNEQISKSFGFFLRIAHSLIFRKKNKQLAQQTVEQIPNTASFFKKEQPCANRSRCSLQMSNCERFALFQEWTAISLFCSQKTSDSLKTPKREFPLVLPCLLVFTSCFSLSFSLLFSFTSVPSHLHFHAFSPLLPYLLTFTLTPLPLH